jgi:hypothetical protein
MALRACDVLDVTTPMHSLTVFIGIEIHGEINRLAANCATYFWEMETTHIASFGRSQLA